MAYENIDDFLDQTSIVVSVSAFGVGCSYHSDVLGGGGIGCSECEVCEYQAPPSSEIWGVVPAASVNIDACLNEEARGCIPLDGLYQRNDGGGGEGGGVIQPQPTNAPVIQSSSGEGNSAPVAENLPLDPSSADCPIANLGMKYVNRFGCECDAADIYTVNCNDGKRMWLFNNDGSITLQVIKFDEHDFTVEVQSAFANAPSQCSVHYEEFSLSCPCTILSDSGGGSSRGGDFELQLVPCGDKFRTSNARIVLRSNGRVEIDNDPDNNKNQKVAIGVGVTMGLLVVISTTLLLWYRRGNDGSNINPNSTLKKQDNSTS